MYPQKFSDSPYDPKHDARNSQLSILLKSPGNGDNCKAFQGKPQRIYKKAAKTVRRWMRMLEV
jgi:hypothetical protein